MTLGAGLLMLLMILARVQTRCWADDFALFRHALAVSGEGHPAAHINLGLAYLSANRLPEALDQLTLASRITPGNGFVHQARGRTLLLLGRTEEGVAALQRAYACDHGDYAATYLLGLSLNALGRPKEAEVYYRIYLDQEPLRLRREFDPARELVLSQEARIALAMTLKDLGRNQEAIVLFGDALRVDARNAAVLLNLGIALGNVGRHEEAVARLEEAQALAPGQEVIGRYLALERARRPGTLHRSP
jgi:tetratricopeptide (TPR) repeat protein